MGDTGKLLPDTEDPGQSAKKSNPHVRWQRTALEQRGYTLNLVLTFTVAVIGYWFSLLRDDTFLPAPRAKCTLLISGLLLALAATFGFACVLVRQWNIHATWRRVSEHPKRRSKAFVRGLDCSVLWLFRFHVWCFLLAVITLATALWMTYGSKLI